MSTPSVLSVFFFEISISFANLSSVGLTILAIETMDETFGLGPVFPGQLVADEFAQWRRSSSFETLD
jgi:hypothetical protein